MRAFTKKYGDIIKLVLVLLCFSILFVELTLFTVWWPAQESNDESTALKNLTAENGKLTRVAENDETMKGDEVNSLNSNKKLKENAKKLADDSESKEINLQIQKLLAPFVNDSLGRVLNIELKTIKSAKGQPEGSVDVLDIVYRKARHGINVLEPKNEKLEPLAGRYVYVYVSYWEQLAMNTRVLMALASQAKLGGRFIVEPKVKDCTFGNTGDPLSTYYNVTQMNTVLKSNGYSTLVSQKEYEIECSITENSQAVLHFLYEDNKAVSTLKNEFGITGQQYDEISRRAKKSGWTGCDVLKPFLSPNLKVFCVDPTVVTEWDDLERGILKDVKCLGIYIWRGIGFKSRTSFSENHLKIASNEIHHLIEPSWPVLNRAEIFTKTHLSGGYIAVQVRGEKVLLQHGLTRLKKCVRLLVNVIENTKRFFGINKVFVASDMSDFGSGSFAVSLKHKKININELKTIHNNLISRISAVVYKPSADWKAPDRGAVSLVELSIAAHAQNLLTVGSGAFQEWAVAKFLEFHRENDAEQWSLTRLCSLP